MLYRRDRGGSYLVNGSTLVVVPRPKHERSFICCCVPWSNARVNVPNTLLYKLKEEICRKAYPEFTFMYVKCTTGWWGFLR